MAGETQVNQGLWDHVKSTKTEGGARAVRALGNSR